MSRPSVREALAALELEGLAEIRHGARRLFVRCAAREKVRGASQAELGDSLLGHHAARCVIEGAIVAGVKPLCKPKDLKALWEIYKEMEYEVEAGRIPVMADRALPSRHRADAPATKCSCALSVRYSTRGTGLAVAKAARPLRKRNDVARGARDEHRAILEALGARCDPGKRAMLRH